MQAKRVARRALLGFRGEDDHVEAHRERFSHRREAGARYAVVVREEGERGERVVRVHLGASDASSPARGIVVRSDRERATGAPTVCAYVPGCRPFGPRARARSPPP